MTLEKKVILDILILTDDEIDNKKNKIWFEESLEELIEVLVEKEY